LAAAEARRRGLLALAPSVTERLRAEPTAFFSLAGRAPDPWQAALLADAGQCILLLCCRQAGKSTLAAALALQAALLRPGALVLLLSPTLRQSGELFRDKVKRLYGVLGRPVATVQESQLQMELANGARVISLPGDEETVRGYSGVDLLVIDEAARVADELYYAVRPMLAVSGGRLIALSTPFGRRGWFCREWHGGEGDGWQRVFVPAGQCPRIPADFLAEERRHLGEDWYAQEYDCRFVEGVGTPLFPAAWLDHAEGRAEALQGRRRAAGAIGVDPGEGVAKTAWAVVDEEGLIELISRPTPDTAVIPGETLALARRYGVPAGRVVFDRGGGGKEHADRLRAQGFAVRTVAFGEAVVAEPHWGRRPLAERQGEREERYAYVNRRAQLYGELAERLDPAGPRGGFGLPAEYTELRRQLAAFPKQYDGEGRLTLPPKQRRAGAAGGAPSLAELLGCSPDEADALALAVYALGHAEQRTFAGVL
jgi:hypothetical protein